MGECLVTKGKLPPTLANVYLVPKENNPNFTTEKLEKWAIAINGLCHEIEPDEDGSLTLYYPHLPEKYWVNVLFDRFKGSMSLSQFSHVMFDFLPEDKQPILNDSGNVSGRPAAAD